MEKIKQLDSLLSGMTDAEVYLAINHSNALNQFITKLFDFGELDGALAKRLQGMPEGDMFGLLFSAPEGQRMLFNVVNNLMDDYGAQYFVELMEKAAVNSEDMTVSTLREKIITCVTKE